MLFVVQPCVVQTLFFFPLMAGSIIWQTSLINLDGKPCAFERLTNSDHVFNV